MENEPTGNESEKIESIPVKAGGCPTAAGLTRSIQSTDLFDSTKTVIIEHCGEQYRLILTKNNKLILQK